MRDAVRGELPSQSNFQQLTPGGRRVHRCEQRDAVMDGLAVLQVGFSRGGAWK